MAQVTASPSQLKAPQEPPQVPPSLQIADLGLSVQKSLLGCSFVLVLSVLEPSGFVVVVVVVVVHLSPSHLVVDEPDELDDVAEDAPLAGVFTSLDASLLVVVSRGEVHATQTV